MLKEFITEDCNRYVQNNGSGTDRQSEYVIQNDRDTGKSGYREICIQRKVIDTNCDDHTCYDIHKDINE